MSPENWAAEKAEREYIGSYVMGSAEALAESFNNMLEMIPFMTIDALRDALGYPPKELLEKARRAYEAREDEDQPEEDDDADD